ncbi:uncharacterized protein [Neodiprion pinetum]|uniref:uncharacterized protein n=1 Tax=Neodiprion pinetum TaxID=441929 RepID=UPI00076FAA62|nr:uncharacterized protein LOC124210956 [Neodiprion pinetum]XP_046603810.1 uncharacterized protein LOC124297151 [Neodiprion virginianus]
MSRPILSRPRTRVYGCNYDKGESYYKPMVDHLDRKYSGRPLFPEARSSLADEIAARRSDIGSRDLAGSRNDSFGRDLDLESEFRPRARPSSEVLIDDEDTVFDSHGQRTRRDTASDNFASEVEATTRRFKARVAALSYDEDLENNRRPKYEPGSKLFESFGASVKAESDRARAAIEDADTAFKRRSRFLSEDVVAEERPALTKWSKVAGLDEDAPSAAATRAKQTRARLNDLETEMEEIAERQAKREQRSAALRAFVNENAAASENLSSSFTSKKVSSVRAERAERSDKHVSF